MNSGRLCWLDVRQGGTAKAAIIEEAIHAGIDGVVAGDPADLEGLPPSVRRVLLLTEEYSAADLGTADVVVVRSTTDRQKIAEEYPDLSTGMYVEIADAAGLETACAAARTERWTVLEFHDPTKIPLEIVIAAAAGASGNMVTVAADPAEAKIIFGVLELGSDGVLMAARAVGDATRLVRSASATTGSIELVELTVTATADIGSGERACVDTCAYLAKDEGMLVGSHSKGMTGSLIGARLYAIFSPDDTSVVLALVVVVATAVACGFLADRYRGRVILWATAIGGAGLVLSSLGYIWPDSLGFLRHPQAGVQEVTHSRLCG